MREQLEPDPPRADIFGESRLAQSRLAYVLYKARQARTHTSGLLDWPTLPTIEHRSITVNRNTEDLSGGEDMHALR